MQIQYRVISNHNLVLFQKTISEMLYDNWTLAGGVCVEVTDGTTWYHQALTK